MLSIYYMLCFRETITMKYIYRFLNGISSPISTQDEDNCYLTLFAIAICAEFSLFPIDIFMLFLISTALKII